MWPFSLSARLSIEALVSRYLTNKLMDRKLIPRQQHETEAIFGPVNIVLRTLFGISNAFAMLSQIRG